MTKRMLAFSFALATISMVDAPLDSKRKVNAPNPKESTNPIRTTLKSCEMYNRIPIL